MRYALSLFALAATATAQQSLLETLSGQEDLSTLLQTAQSVPAFAAVLGLSNITILAPTNEAFAAVDQNSALGRAIAGNDTDYLAGVLAYHVIMGNYTASDVEETPQFVHTLLNDTYQFNGQPLANVTGGQNVELLKNGDEVTILSGSLAESNVTEAVSQLQCCASIANNREGHLCPGSHYSQDQPCLVPS